MAGKRVPAAGGISGVAVAPNVVTGQAPPAGPATHLVDDKGDPLTAEELLEYPQMLNRGALVRVKRRVYQVGEYRGERTVLLRYPAGAMISLAEAEQLKADLVRGK